MKNFNHFLNGKEINRRDSGNCNRSNGIDVESIDVEKNVNVEQSTATNESSASEEIKMITSNPKVQIDIENALKLIEADSRNHLEMDINNNAETIPNGSIHIKSNDIKIEIKHDHELNEEVEKSETNVNTLANSMEAVREGKPQLKAKFLRQQRRAEKQMAKADGNLAETDQKLLRKKVLKNTEKTLKSLIEEMPTDGQHKLKVCI